MSNEFTIEHLGVLEGHGAAVTSLVCGENKDGSPLLLSGSRDKSIIRWELNFDGTKVTYKDDQDNEKVKILVGKPLRSFHGHNHFVSSLALNSDNTKLVSGSWDKTIRLWDIESAKSDLLFKGHTKDVLSVGFSHDERLIFSGAMDNTLKYWNTKGDLRYDNNQFKGWVSCILNIKKGKTNYIAVGCWDGSVKILNNEYNLDRELPGGEYAVTSLSTDADGDFLFIAYKNGTIKVYNIQEEASDNEEDNVKQTILMLFYSIVNSLKFMLLEQAKDYKLEKLKEVLNQSLKIKLELVFLLLIIKTNHIYLLDLPMEPLEFIKLQITVKVK